MNTTEINENSLIITRAFATTIDHIWRAWTVPEQVMQWWGPAGFTAPHIDIDFRVGGKYLFCMHGVPEPGAHESDFWSTGIYTEIVPMKKIVYTDCFADEHGNVVSASKYGMNTLPDELLVTVTFEPSDDQVIMTLTHLGMPNDIGPDCAIGWNGSFDKMQTLLQNMQG